MNRAGWTLAGVAIVFAGLTGMARAPAHPAAPAGATARLGPLTVNATALRPGPSGTLTATVRVTTSGSGSDQLDAAIANGVPAELYHQVISLTDVPDLALCGGADIPPPGVVSQWMHDGPLVVYGRSAVPSPLAAAILTVTAAGTPPPGGKVSVTLYFANAGSVVLPVPVSAASTNA